MKTGKYQLLTRTNRQSQDVLRVVQRWDPVLPYPAPDDLFEANFVLHASFQEQAETRVDQSEEIGLEGVAPLERHDLRVCFLPQDPGVPVTAQSFVRQGFQGVGEGSIVVPEIAEDLDQRRHDVGISSLLQAPQRLASSIDVRRKNLANRILDVRRGVDGTILRCRTNRERKDHHGDADDAGGGGKGSDEREAHGKGAWVSCGHGNSGAATVPVA